MSLPVPNLPLFSRRKIARRTDPVTSHEAAEEVTQSGRRERQLAHVLEAVKRWPDKTSAELAELMGVDRYVPARRLPELRSAGLIVNGVPRDCTVNKTRGITWTDPSTSTAQTSRPSPGTSTSADL